MNETGVVKSVENGMAKVVFERKPMCKNCGACIKAGADEMMVIVENELGAREGDKVAVTMNANAFLSATLIMYGVPLIALLIGLFVPLLFGASEVIAAIAGVFCAIASYFLIKLYEPKFSKNKKYKHRMADITERAQGQITE